MGFVSEVFKESSKAIAEIPSLFLQPVITFLVLLAFFAFWTTIAVFLATASKFWEFFVWYFSCF